MKSSVSRKIALVKVHMRMYVVSYITFPLLPLNLSAGQCIIKLINWWNSSSYLQRNTMV